MSVILAVSAGQIFRNFRLFFSFSFSFALVCVRAWCTVCCVASSVACFPLLTVICSNRLTSDFTTAVFLSFATSNWIFSPFSFFFVFSGKIFCKTVHARLAGATIHVAIIVNKLCSERTASSSSQVSFFLLALIHHVLQVCEESLRLNRRIWDFFFGFVIIVCVEILRREGCCWNRFVFYFSFVEERETL